VECSFNEDIAKLNGCDPTLLHLPDLSDTKVVSDDSDSTQISFFNAAEVLEMIYQTIITDKYGLIVVDSVAGLMYERLISDEDPNKSGVSELARIMSDKLKKIVPACKKTKTSVIFINQLRDQPGAYIQNRFHSPGGRALKFLAHQRIGMEKRGGAAGKVYVDGEDGKREMIGHYAKINIVKNRLAAPVPEDLIIEVPVYYREYFPDNAKKCYDLARKLQVITIRGSTLTWKENNQIVLQVDGEAGMLAKIRDEKLEPRLAAACVLAEQDDKNTTKKTPIRVPQTMKDLAMSCLSGSLPVTVTPEKPAKGKKKGTIGKLDLDE